VGARRGAGIGARLLREVPQAVHRVAGDEVSGVGDLGELVEAVVLVGRGLARRGARGKARTGATSAWCARGAISSTR
jgi:hypothetical protein